MDTFLTAHNPFTQQPIGAVAQTPPTELRSRFERARVAQELWERIPVRERKQYFRNLREVLVAQAREISQKISLATSKPYTESLSAEVFGTLETLRWCLDQGPNHLRPKILWMGRYWFLLRQSVVQQRALGVIGILSPWNFPFAIPLGQILPAVLAGNAVILKPSELTPTMGMLIEELFQASGFPPDLIQVVHGSREVGEALVASGVDKILFTGSSEVGFQVAAKAASLGVPTCLELGGKDAMVVLADADLERATSGALWGAFTNCGQVCASIERAFVHDTLYDRFVALMKKKMQLLTQGPPNEFADIGTVISPAQKQKVLQAIETVKREGGQIYQARSASLLIQPTLVENVTPEMSIAQKEVFGPVLPVLRFSSDADVIRTVNNSGYGLSASVWSESLSHARAIAHHLNVGTVTINGSAYTHAFPMTPWGGVKRSGWGRTHGRWGLNEVTRVHHVHWSLTGPRDSEFWWFGYSQNLFEILLDLVIQFTRPGKFGWLLSLFPFLAAKREKKY